MSYTYQHQHLTELFTLNKENIKIPGSGIEIRNMEFISSFRIPAHSTSSIQGIFSNEDSKIKENWNFIYPVFVPGNRINNRAIILLHGLNERDWSKYLTWVNYLAEQTRRTIILFPLAFHMNRGKKEWSDPRSMNMLANSRKKFNQNIFQLSFANAALSSRLTEDPMRFYRAGLQSAHDLIQLLGQIKDGAYPLLEKNTQVNFLVYSIGAFLTQIMFMANPGNILKDSKALLFCGGTTFNNMSGTSKLIMDNLAYEKLNQFYLEQFGKDTSLIPKNQFSIRLNSVVQSFKAMIPLPSFNRLKEQAFSRLAWKISAIGLLKDRVIPAKDILETLKDDHGKLHFPFHLADFPYNYSHENSFPILKAEQAKQVDKSFEKIFSRIALSLK